MDIATIRTDYKLATLNEESAGSDPMAFFQKWFAEASAAHIDEVNAMTLATAGANGRPHARIVLLKGIDKSGFQFFTNYESAKGNEIAEQHFAALVFFWKELERQVRIEGIAVKVDDATSNQYFSSRPSGSRIGAWASPQSRPIADRSIIESAAKKFEEQFADDIPRPSFWGGYCLVPDKIEFWQGRSNRMHDRIVFDREGLGWKHYRIAP